MKNLLITFILLFAAYTASMAQCRAFWVGYSNANNTAYFSDSSSTNPSVTTYFWDFGDGGTSTDQYPVHQYSVSDTYNICFVIETDVNGSLCTDTFCNDLYVGPLTGSCQAYFTATVNPNGTALYSFDNQSQVSGGSPLYNWDFGDGGTSNNAYPTHMYTASGTYTVTLVTRAYGGGQIVCTDTFRETLTVVITPPVCDATFGHQTSGLDVYFTPSNFSNTSAFDWSFGDGQYGYGTNVTHSYNAGGTYSVCLIARDSLVGCADTSCISITVTGGPVHSCNAALATSVTLTNPTNYTYYFDGTNPNNIPYHSHLWQISDGTVDTSETFSHQFSSAGSYSVCHTVGYHYQNGASICSDSHCDTIVVGNTNTGPYIWGNVWSDSSNGVWNEATVWLIQYDSLNETLTAIDSTVTQYGLYQFNQVANGDYLVKAALQLNSAAYDDYLPTYYQSVLFWDDATTVNVPTTNANGSNIALQQGNNPGGPGFVGGNVNAGANKQASGDPLGGVQVMLLDMSDNPVQYTYTAADGSFSFSNLAHGSYKVYAELLGKPTFPAVVTLTATKESVNDVAIVVEEEGVYTAVTEVDVTYIGQTNLYPNPVANTATLSFNAKEAGNVTLQVLNMLGQVVAEHQLDVLPGNQFATIDMASQHTGVYSLSISFNNQVASRIRFVKN